MFGADDENRGIDSGRLWSWPLDDASPLLELKWSSRSLQFTGLCWSELSQQRPWLVPAASLGFGPRGPGELWHSLGESFSQLHGQLAQLIFSVSIFAFKIWVFMPITSVIVEHGVGRNILLFLHNIHKASGTWILTYIDYSLAHSSSVLLGYWIYDCFQLLQQVRMFSLSP